MKILNHDVTIADTKAAVVSSMSFSSLVAMIVCIYVISQSNLGCITGLLYLILGIVSIVAFALMVTAGRVGFNITKHTNPLL